ncbi:MAG: ribonuclease III [Anaerolineae bacterium]|nr:ribonuclease III [Anaerolineae bacterium]RIK23716.1 MAG: ribonuclease III [Anaerolineae bacterium]
MEDLLELSARLGVEFSDYSLLSRALTHRSYLNENHGSILEDNERLEYLGDAVIDFIVAGYLYHRFPEMDEGELTALRAALVRAETLARFARAIDLGRYLRLGIGEEESGGRERITLLCATFEAVIGAIYIDRGLDVTRPIIEGHIRPMLEQIQAGELHKDAKSEFQVWAQAQFNQTPQYRVIDSEGPDHAKVFTVRVMVGEETWGEGRGRSKQIAAQAAAAEAMARAGER